MLKRLFKWALRLIALLLVLAVVLLLARNAILKAVAEREIRAQTGMDVSIGRLSVGLLSPVVDIGKLKLYNPPQFGGTLLLDAPELHAEYDADALARRRLHVKLLRLNLAELNVVRNETGQTNLLDLMSKATTAQPGGKGWGRIEFTGVDVLNLSLGRLRYVDLKQPQHSRELKSDAHERIFNDVKTEADLYGVLFLIWLRSGGSTAGSLMAAPPEIVPGPIPRAGSAAKK